MGRKKRNISIYSVVSRSPSIVILRVVGISKLTSAISSLGHNSPSTMIRQQTDGVDLVHEDDARLMVSCVAEHLADQTGALADVLVDNRTRDDLRTTIAPRFTLKTGTVVDVSPHPHINFPVPTPSPSINQSINQSTFVKRHKSRANRRRISFNPIPTGCNPIPTPSDWNSSPSLCSILTIIIKR